ncbi:thiol oxidoreductase [Flavobacteriaceae bacterium]|nr:thiol oxidoreductase [Flavobacteriaceae bacterium]
MKKIIIKILIYSLILFFNSCNLFDDHKSMINYDYVAIYEEGEELLAGNLSVKTNSKNSFGKEIPGLIFKEKIAFGLGNSLFSTPWISVGSTTAIDGLGPTFNARSCIGCHSNDGRGKPLKNGENSMGFILRLSIDNDSLTGEPIGHQTYGKQIQDQSNIGVQYEAKVNVNYQTLKGIYPDGTKYELRKPSYTIVDKNFGEINNIKTSPRVAQQVIGLGLIDALSEKSILLNVDEFDKNNDGISGKANYVTNVITKKSSIGKFGWKANQPSLRQQIGDAFNGDMGLTSSVFTNQNCPLPQDKCNDYPNGGDPEVIDSQIDNVVFYQSSIAVPKRRNFKKQNVLEGKVLFNKSECIKCHAKNFKTSKSIENKHLEGKIIHPFSDFLLHDMGEGLADNRNDFLANGKEWRTQPLWGIGLIPKVNKHTYLLHDGRARNIEEAILWHGGEAENSKIKFMNLSSIERKKVIDYINSL